jgi:multidrug resistance efflux pump
MTDKNKPVISEQENSAEAVKDPALFKEPPRVKKRFNLIWPLLMAVCLYMLWPKSGIEGIAVVKADRLAQLGLTSSGILEGVFHKEGDVVNQGDLLAKFRNPDLEKQYAEKKAALEILNHDLTLLKKKKDFQVKEKQRKNLLAENGAIGLVELDIADLALSQIEEEIVIKGKEISSLGGETAFLKQCIDSLELKAPFAGILMNDPQNRVGNFLKAGDFVLELVDPSSFYLQMSIGEKDIERLGVGNQIDARFHAFPNKTYSGKISRLAPKTEDEVEKVFKIRHVIPVKISLDEFPASAKYEMRAGVIIKPKAVTKARPGKSLGGALS